MSEPPEGVAAGTAWVARRVLRSARKGPDEDNPWGRAWQENLYVMFRSLLLIETEAEKAKLRPVLIYGGFPLSAKHVLDAIMPGVEELHAIYR